MAFGEQSEEELLSIAASLESHANHPIARAFKPYLNHSVLVTDVENVIGSGLQGVIDGKLVKIGNAHYVLGRDDAALNSVYMSIDGQHVATFEYRDPIRKEAVEFINKMREAGVKTTLLTGDTLSNAEPVAKEVGIDDVIASASPSDKLNYLKSLDSDDITMMIGDGINDAPTLAGAHLSIAMGGGTDVAKASADLVLLGDRLDKILTARELALRTRKIIRENLAWSLGYNVLILPLAVAGSSLHTLRLWACQQALLLSFQTRYACLKKKVSNMESIYILIPIAIVLVCVLLPSSYGR